MNQKVETQNNNKSTGERSTSKFTQKEFITGHALFIGAADSAFANSCCSLWEHAEANDEAWHSIVAHTNFSSYMKLYPQYKQFRKFAPRIWNEEEKAQRYPWWQFRSAVENLV
jgi:hypothetical protein